MKEILVIMFVFVTAFAVMSPFDMLNIVGRTTHFDATYAAEYEANWKDIQNNYTWSVQSTPQAEARQGILEDILGYLKRLLGVGV